jgi:hypothetical protein
MQGGAPRLSPNDCFRCDACRMMQGPRCMQSHHHARARGQCAAARLVASVALYTPGCVPCCVQWSALHVAAKAARCRISLMARPCSPPPSASCPRRRSAPSPRVPRGPVRVGRAARACLCASLRARASEAGEAGAGDSLGLAARARARVRAGARRCSAPPQVSDGVGRDRPSVGRRAASIAHTHSQHHLFRMPCRHCRRR